MNTNTNTNTTVNTSVEVKHNLYTHGGIFHADDVFSTALLQLLWGVENCSINRVFSVNGIELTENDIVFDIGLGEFDHHQEEKEYHADGTPYAAFGKLWRKFGATFFDGDEEAAKKIEEHLVIPIDKQDNGETRNLLSESIKEFNPCWNEDNSPAAQMKSFMTAVGFARAILDREIKKLQATIAATEETQAAASSSINGVMVLERYIPITKDIPANVMFAIYPALRGGYNLNCIPKDDGTFGSRKLLPASWLNDKPAGCTFVHQGRFIAAFERKEDAIEAAMSLNKEV